MRILRSERLGPHRLGEIEEFLGAREIGPQHIERGLIVQVGGHERVFLPQHFLGGLAAFLDQLDGFVEILAPGDSQQAPQVLARGRGAIGLPRLFLFATQFFRGIQRPDRLVELARLNPSGDHLARNHRLVGLSVSTRRRTG